MYAYVNGNPVSNYRSSWVDGAGGGGSATHPGPVCDQSAPRWPDFIHFELDFYVWSLSSDFTRGGNAYVGFGPSANWSNPLRLAASVNGGWLNQSTVTPDQVDNFVAGYTGGSSAGYAVAGGGLIFSPGSGSATIVGFGAGVTLGPTSSVSVASGGGYSWNTGSTGLRW